MIWRPQWRCKPRFSPPCHLAFQKLHTNWKHHVDPQFIPALFSYLVTKIKRQANHIDCAIYDIHSKLILNRNLMKFRFPIITSFSVSQSVWNLVQSSDVVELRAKFQNDWTNQADDEREFVRLEFKMSFLCDTASWFRFRCRMFPMN